MGAGARGVLGRAAQRPAAVAPGTATGSATHLLPDTVPSSARYSSQPTVLSNTLVICRVSYLFS